MHVADEMSLWRHVYVSAEVCCVPIIGDHCKIRQFRLQQHKAMRNSLGLVSPLTYFWTEDLAAKVPQHQCLATKLSYYPAILQGGHESVSQ